MEEIIKAQQGLDMVVDDLRQAIKKADPITYLLLERYLVDACNLNVAISRLASAIDELS